jgi:signal transduction histidine kinase
MSYNSITNIESCYIQLPHLLYYSHIPAIAVSLLLGIFIYYKNRTLVSKILFGIAITFSLWAAFSLITWISVNSVNIMFVWSLFGLLDVLLFILFLYFAYVFIDKKDVSIAIKSIWGLLLLITAIIIPTTYNLEYFDVVECSAAQNRYAYNYFLPAIEIFLIIWLFAVVIHRYKKADVLSRKKIVSLAIGIFLFLFSFFVTNYLTDILNSTSISISNYDFEQYGLFGMLFFMAFLAYLIVRYKAFDIKLIATQALVVGLVILIGSQFFFIQNPTNKILNGITLALALGFGYVLVKSVKIEVKRKEELQSLSDQLSDANAKLRQLDKAKSEFISIASHQLRTPLTSIKGFGSLLLEGTYGVVPEAQRGALEKIYISNERLIQLVEDLLNISRIEAGRMEFDFQEAQIEDLVQEAVMTLELSAKTKSLYLHWEKPAIAMPKLKIDVTKIKEVISNMIDNAIKYTQKGGITVKLESNTDWDSEHKEHQSTVRVIVSDTGIGMDAEEIGMIFEKFQRGKQVSHYHTDGTGLGMFIGRKIVAEHKGKIWAESDGKGMGSRFVLELPVS